MFFIEFVRCVGFCDFYLFFIKYKKFFKIIVNDEEKCDMIECDIILYFYKGCSIGIVIVRFVFCEFGVLIIVGGWRIIDDYNVVVVCEDGVVEGELVDFNDIYDFLQFYNKN